MTCRFPLLVLVVAALPLAAQQRQVRGRHTVPDPAIRLWVPAGLIEVEAWDRDSIEVRVTPRPGTRLIGGGAASAVKYALERTTPSDTVLPSAQMRVFVPRKAKLWIKSTVASVFVRGARGQLDVLQVSGDTHVDDARGVVTLESIDGEIRVNGVEGTLRVRGGAGDVALGNLAGTVEATLVSGGVTLAAGAGRGQVAPPLSGRIETVGGRIWLTGELGPLSRLELSTHDGPITLMLMGERPPKIENHVADADLRLGTAGPGPNAATIILRSFKGRVNAQLMRGIQ